MSTTRVPKTRRWPIVSPNEDKPHRCPECHGIPDEIRTDGGTALSGKTYACERCHVHWVAP